MNRAFILSGNVRNSECTKKSRIGSLEMIFLPEWGNLVGWESVIVRDLAFGI
jgi:hypothetical protein